MTKDGAYVIAVVNRQLFAVATSYVREMTKLPDLASVPDLPPDIRGVVNLRGRVLPVWDTRRRMGRRAASEDIAEFCNLMTQREQDHVNWLTALETSVRQNSEFKLTLDPHGCAFGKKMV